SVGLSLERRPQTIPSRAGGGGVNAVSPEGVVERVQAFDWERVSHDLDAEGSAFIKRLLAPDECREIAGLYPKDDLFRSRIVMAPLGCGRGEPKFFTYPLRALLTHLRPEVYPHFAPIPNR